MTAEVRNAIQLLPPMHNVHPLAGAAVAQGPQPNFNLPMRELTDLAHLNMLLSDKANIVAYVSEVNLSNIAADYASVCPNFIVSVACVVFGRE